MRTPRAGGLEIHIGAPIQYESERSTLKEIGRLLAADGRRGVAFANFTVGSHQIDLVVVLDGLVLVIEAKTGRSPVRGGANGAWQSRLSTGEWRDFANPYLQTRDAVFALKDAMVDFCRRGVSFVSAALVFAPEIPRESCAFQGDRMVSVIGHDGLPALLGKVGANAWSRNQWTAFAEHLSLTRVDSVAAACDVELVEAEARIRQYAAMFCQTYEDYGKLVPFTCVSNGETVASSEVKRLVCEQGGAVLLAGATGCGKSLLAWSSGSAFCRQGGVALAVQAREFDGSVKEVLDREAGLLGSVGAARVLEDSRRLGKAVLFIVDGYNECAEDRRGLLTRGVAALVRKYDAQVVVTSRIPLMRGDLLELRKIDVPHPTMETKVAIAEHASGGETLAKEVEDLLAAVSSGLEARLLGELGGGTGRGASRYALFDEYARKRLGEEAGECIRVLSLVAAWLCERLAFSMSVRDLDRLLDSNGANPPITQLIVERGLLALRGDRVSFSHEMFFDVFAAEALVRQAKGAADLIVKALGEPLHAERGDLVIGAIDDDLVLEKLLPRLDNYASVKACLTGRCGSAAQVWAQEHCRSMWARVGEEAERARFRVEGEETKWVEFEKESLNQWSSCDRAFFAVLPELLGDGLYLEETLDAVGVLDGRICEEWRRLREEVGGGHGNSRSELFQMAFVHPGRSRVVPGISEVCRCIGNGMFLARGGGFGSRDEAALVRIRRRLLEGELSAGQLYVLLHLCRGVEIPASFLSRTIDRRWRGAPYHLRLVLLDSAGLYSSGEDADRAKLIERLEGLLEGSHPFLCSIVMEALQRLGALDDHAREHRAVVRQNVSECLARPDDPERQAEAWRIYSSQFDHPYSDAYWEVVSGLDGEEHKGLLDMAARGASNTDLWLGPLLLELGSFGDRGVGDSIARWTVLPPQNNRILPQSDIQVFVVAHIALARLGYPLPERRDLAENPSVRALAACGAILYWSNRIDLDERQVQACCAPGVDTLTGEARDGALDVVRECESISREGFDLLPGDRPIMHSIVGRFPAETAGLCRDALLEPKRQLGYFRHFSQFEGDRILEFAVEVLKHYGSRTDHAILRTYARTAEYGRGAMEALKVIEEREAKSTQSVA